MTFPSAIDAPRDSAWWARWAQVRQRRDFADALIRGIDKGWPDAFDTNWLYMLGSTGQPRAYAYLMPKLDSLPPGHTLRLPVVAALGGATPRPLEVGTRLARLRRCTAEHPEADYALAVVVREGHPVPPALLAPCPPGVP